MSNQGQYRISGNWGSVRDSAGNVVAEIVALEATIEVARVTVPLVGSQQEGYKRGRQTREGTMRVQKIDSKWERRMWNFIGLSPQEKRRIRDTGSATVNGQTITDFDPAFSVTVWLDDPEALGSETWQLDGCRIWRLPLGFDQNDEIIIREYPFTFEAEKPIRAFTRKAQAGDDAADYWVGSSAI
jgi:hypothetical protein